MRNAIAVFFFTLAVTAHAQQPPARPLASLEFLQNGYAATLDAADTLQKLVTQQDEAVRRMSARAKRKQLGDILDLLITDRAALTHLSSLRLTLAAGADRLDQKDKDALSEKRKTLDENIDKIDDLINKVQKGLEGVMPTDPKSTPAST